MSDKEIEQGHLTYSQRCDYYALSSLSVFSHPFSATVREASD